MLGFAIALPSLRADQLKAIFIEQIQQNTDSHYRACPTNGSDCGSLRDHNLSLFVMCYRDSLER